MFGIISLVVAGVSLVLDVVGLAIPYWAHDSIEQVTVNIGLWQACTSGGGASACVTIPEVANSLKATRAMEILGMLVLAAAVACFVLKMFVMKQQNMLPKVGAAMAIVGGTLAIVGCVIFATKVKKDYPIPGLSLHAGFALCIVAAVGSYVSAVLSFLNKQE